MFHFCLCSSLLQLVATWELTADETMWPVNESFMRNDSPRKPFTCANRFARYVYFPYRKICSPPNHSSLQFLFRAKPPNANVAFNESERTFELLYILSAISYWCVLKLASCWAFKYVQINLFNVQNRSDWDLLSNKKKKTSFHNNHVKKKNRFRGDCVKLWLSDSVSWMNFVKICRHGHNCCVKWIYWQQQVNDVQTIYRKERRFWNENRSSFHCN